MPEHDDPLLGSPGPGDDLDDRIRSLVALAVADAPPAPARETIDGAEPIAARADDARRPAPGRTRRRGMVAAAAGLAAATAVVFVVLDDEEAVGPAVDTAPVTTVFAAIPAPVADPEPPVQLPEPIEVTTQPPPSTAATAAPPDLGFTPLQLTELPPGYTIDYAAHGGGSRTPDDIGVVRYRAEAGPAIELTIRPAGEEALDAVRELGRPTFEVAGRTVFADGEAAGCLTDHCSVRLQWDGSTNVSVAWVGSSRVPLGPEHSIDRLAELTTALAEAEPSAFRHAPVPTSPAISRQAVAIAGDDGVAIDDGLLSPWRVTDDEIERAIVLADGRVLLQRSLPAGPGDLALVPAGAAADGSVVPEPFWPAGEAGDGSVRINIWDSALEDGFHWLLYETITGPCERFEACDAALKVVDVDGPVEPRTIYREPSSLGVSNASAYFFGASSNLAVGSYALDAGPVVPLVLSTVGDEDAPLRFRLVEGFDARGFGVTASGDGDVGWFEQRTTTGYDLVIAGGDDDPARLPLDGIGGIPREVHLQLRRVDGEPLRGKALITVSPATDPERLDVVALDVVTGVVTTLATDVNSATIGPR